MSEFLTKKEFETWKRNLERRIAHVANLIIERGSMTVPVGSSVSVTFASPFPDVPDVYSIGPNSANPFIVNIHTVTKTGFQATGIRWDNGASTSKVCTWIAILN
jgi:hypothetical protein